MKGEKKLTGELDTTTGAWRGRLRQGHAGLRLRHCQQRREHHGRCQDAEGGPHRPGN